MQASERPHLDPKVRLSVHGIAVDLPHLLRPAPTKHLQPHSHTDSVRPVLIKPANGIGAVLNATCCTTLGGTSVAQGKSTLLQWTTPSPQPAAALLLDISTGPVRCCQHDVVSLGGPAACRSGCRSGKGDQTLAACRIQCECQVVSVFGPHLVDQADVGRGERLSCSSAHVRSTTGQTGGRPSFPLLTLTL